MTLRERKLQALLIEAQSMSDIRRFDLGYLSLRYGIPFKAVCEHLEQNRVIPDGAYDEIIQMGVTVKYIRDFARKQYPVIEKWKETTNESAT